MHLAFSIFKEVWSKKLHFKIYDPILKKALLKNILTKITLENSIKFWIIYLIHEYSSLTQVILSTFLGASHNKTREHTLLFFIISTTPLQPTQFWFKEGVKSFRYVVLTPFPLAKPCACHWAHTNTQGYYSSQGI